MFLEPRESHGLCPLWALMHLRAGALGSCELERPGQQGVERTSGHTEGRCPAKPGTRCGSGWQPVSPGPSLWEGRQPFGRQGAAPPQSPGDPVCGSGRGMQMSVEVVLHAGEEFEEWVGFAQHSGFSEKR